MSVSRHRGGPIGAAVSLSGTGLCAARWLAVAALAILSVNVSMPPAWATAGDISTVAGPVDPGLPSVDPGVDSTLQVAGNCRNGQPATSAALRAPNSPAFDDAGNLFFADRSGHRICKMDTSGNITTVAGNGTKGDAGDGGPAVAAQLNFPTSVAIVNTAGAAQYILIADQGNHRVRLVNLSTSPVSAYGATVPVGP